MYLPNTGERDGVKDILGSSYSENSVVHASCHSIKESNISPSLLYFCFYFTVVKILLTRSKSQTLKCFISISSSIWCVHCKRKKKKNVSYYFLFFLANFAVSSPDPLLLFEGHTPSWYHPLNGVWFILVPCLSFCFCQAELLVSWIHPAVFPACFVSGSPLEGQYLYPLTIWKNTFEHSGHASSAPKRLLFHLLSPRW